MKMTSAAATPATPDRNLNDTQAPGVIRVMRDDGSVDPERDPGLSDADLIKLYEAMVRVRLVDDRMVTLQRQGRVGFHVGSLGEEAAILGSTFVMRERDWIFPCYREFGSALLRGLPLQTYVDNMFGNGNDQVKGRQMPDHVTYRAGNFFTTSSTVGTQITPAVGVAWAAKIRRDDVATISIFGDGATSTNDFHAGMNFAAVFKVPAIFFCRNNGWAISTPAAKQTASASFAEKGLAYGVPFLRCDGNDLLAVVAATREALARAIRGDGPTLIEAITYRISGHTTNDDPKIYQKEDEIDVWRRVDPLARLRNVLAVRGLWDDARQAAFEHAVQHELKAAIAAAEKAPPPGRKTLFEDVYAEMPWHLAEQYESLLKTPRPDPEDR
jgi:pyruvate dehydrogenase E1 component alpha subunit